MYTKLLKAMEAYPVNRCAGVLCALSGGADSVALVHLMARLGGESGFPVYAAHFNHGIRGAEADRDEAFARSLCKKLGVPFFVGRGDAPALARSEGIPLEQAARRLRYQYFAEALALTGAQCVAAAHHMDDQAETVLMHIMRGSGVHGLRGMDFFNAGDNGVPVIRPLLGVRRAEIEAYIAENGLEYVTDSTNLTPDARRNRVRLELLPYIESNYNSNIVESLAVLARMAALDDDCLNSLAESALVPVRGGYDRRRIAEEAYPVRVRALFLLLQRSGARVDTERKHIEAADALLTATSGSAIDLPGARLRVSGECITCEPLIEAEPWEAQFSEAGFDTPSGRVECRAWTGEPFSEDVQAIDLDKLPASATVRNRRAGDVVRPVGAPGAKKLKELFIDKKIPKELRDGLPLIADGGNVLAVFGVCTAESVKIDEATRRGLLMKYYRTEDKR